MTSSPEIKTHDTGYHDNQGRRIQYETSIQPTSNGRAWRVHGRQLRDGKPVGRGSVPLHVFSEAAAQSMARSLFHRHCRYVERHTARAEVRAAAAEEDLHHLAARI